MESLIQFIDSFSIDEKLYWQLPSSEPGKFYDIKWERDCGKTHWHIKTADEKTWQPVPSEKLVETLDRLPVNERDLQKQIGTSIMTQAIFAEQYLNSAKKLLGSENIERGLDKARNLMDMISNLTQSQSQTQAQTPKKKPGLRLVKNRPE